VTLGRVALRGPAGEDAELGKRQRKLALLAVLALARRAPTRAELAEMFWGDEDEERARHSLSDALSHLRRVLGRDAIAARREVVELDAGGRLAVDAVELEAACEARDWERAAALYGGPFLAGLHVDRSATFDAWVSRARDRYAHLFAQACEARCAALAREARWAECRTLALRWLDAAPRNAEPALWLMRAALAGGAAEQRQGLADFEAYAARLAREHDAKPDARVEALARQLGERVELVAADYADFADFADAPHVVLGESSVERSTEQAKHAAKSAKSAANNRQHPRRWRLVLGTAAAAVALLVLGAALGRRTGGVMAAERPLVAVAEVRTPPGDTTLAWLGDGMAQMLAADLARAGALDVVAPALVHDAAVRDPDPLHVARRVHATWAVSARVAHDEGTYLLEVTVRDARDGATLRRYAVTGADVMSVADQAAAYLLATADPRAPGVHFGDVETTNTEAFRHFVRGQQLLAETRVGDADTAFDAAIAADSGFVSAIVARLRGRQYAVDSAGVARLIRLLDRAAARMTEWDRMEQAVYVALHEGEHARAELLGRELLARYPRDPRAYETLANIYATHGRVADADSVLARLLALDSLALSAREAGGACAACTALRGLAALRTPAAAESLARRWIALQPASAGAWQLLGDVLGEQQRADEALVAFRRAAALRGDAPGFEAASARVLLAARRYDAAAALATPWAADSGDAGGDATDVLALIQRERGQFRAAAHTLESLDRRGKLAGLRLEYAQTLAWIGEPERARAYLERRIQHDLPHVPEAGLLRADPARAFAWEHAVGADAVWQTADTAWLRAIADSVQRVGAMSYYARDWAVHHQIRGLLAERAGRWEEARREFAQAPAAWTRTRLELARADLALGRADEAVAALRPAYREPLDAAGRYQPRSEMDFVMARAFARAGRRDSAHVYADYVRAAWRDADPEVRATLAELPP